MPEKHRTIAPDGEKAEEEAVKQYYKLRKMPLKWVRKTGVFVDVGANPTCGYNWTERILEDFDPVEIHSFEPAPEPFRQLQERHGDDKRVNLYRVCLSDHEGIAKFINHHKHEGGWGHEKFLNNRPEYNSTNVEVKTLDSYGLEPDFIKTDCDGMDIEVLRGAVETIKRHKPAIFCEIKAAGRDYRDEIAEFLRKFGYGEQIRKGPDAFFV